LYDIEVDVNRGATNAVIKRGVDCLVQGVFLRATIEQGTDILYKRLGTKRLVGLNNATLDLEIARYRFSQAISADPRIATVRRLKFEDTSSDALVIDADAEVRGLAQNSNIKIVI
jgi:hypothetical protein